MKCKRCNNEDPSYFYKGHKGYYCRKCIRFSRVLLMEDLNSLDYDINLNVEEYNFSYSLTDKQIQASNKCLQYLKDNNDILLYCVCGAGKTEIVIASIAYYLARGLRVCYAISRKEVVIELEKRFKTIFPKANVVAVYGGHHNIIIGDLIVCTNHQLYRYYQTFDLLILDEVDAFPLKGNETLMNVSLNACAGNVIFSSATIDNNLRNVLKNRKYKKVELFVRPSFLPMVIPKIIIINKYLSILCLFVLLKKMKRQCIIFVSSKKICRNLYYIFHKLYSITYVYSDLDKRQENIDDFKNKKYQFIISTTVLERGITISDIDVIILDYDHIFDQSNLIQMLGRINRGLTTNEGKAYIFTASLDKKIIETIKYLRKANSYL